ncbi:MarR family winged helix-turn-helix transcriptional regulator [Mycolicibacterium goodii]|uniref:MarR family winged helix-turn-helix transcriptional regulator n=1 Tax=Mycolicibacterium goodii TaxID=134601 RepID=UPI001BDDC63E|nr:MarR family transcriptional regulator [Mycolicibacterium goodii]MBU8828819.1 MarR family transcriptional regulator [Mycolicibacterium goodii]ULN44968.1 MarR family transcriptional regulator [Mycolicibacterium goodii]
MDTARDDVTIPDTVDRIRREWTQAYPHFDTSPIEVLGRVQRIASVCNHRLDADLARHDVNRSEFTVLSALARAERPLRASEVVSTTMLSGASITKIAESLVGRGLVVRHRSERDGRVVLLELTDAGRGVVEDEMPRRLADDEQLIAGLTATERETLAALLRKVCAALGE